MAVARLWSRQVEISSSRELIVMLAGDAPPSGSGSVASVLRRAHARMTPLFEAGLEGPPSPGALHFMHVRAEDAVLDDLAIELRRHPAVIAAYVKPPAEPALNTMAPSGPTRPQTPNFVRRQGYLLPSPKGIDARHAWGHPGGRGQGVKVADVEWAWNVHHEDLAGITHLSGNMTSSAENHGTAVAGIIYGRDNGFGVMGIAPDCKLVTVAIDGAMMPSATAIQTAARALSAGDVLLIEVHRAGPRHNFQPRGDQQGYIAVEWWEDDFAAIQFAIRRKIIVVEAAGNGGEHLDDALYDVPGPGFPVSWSNPFCRKPGRDSGAIIVGAGAPPPNTHGRTHGPDRSRLSFSNYGSMVDAQGWGQEVTTCGYGDLQGGPTTRWYTDQFSGTSAASPIIAGAIAILQGTCKARRVPPRTHVQLRTLLRTTGAPQQYPAGSQRNEPIGNRPDLKALITHLPQPQPRTARSTAKKAKTGKKASPPSKARSTGKRAGKRRR